MKLPKVVLKPRPRPNPSEQEILETLVPQTLREAFRLAPLLQLMAQGGVSSHTSEQNAIDQATLLGYSGPNDVPEGILLRREAARAFSYGAWTMANYIAARMGYLPDMILEESGHMEFDAGQTLEKIVESLRRHPQHWTVAPEDLV
jgi:hypothetical protein